MVNGEGLHAVGQMKAPWRFTDELAQVYGLELLVFADVPFEVIIGNDFLQASETYIPRPQNVLHVRTANILGVPSQRILGKIDRAKVLALADTGSEQSLVSHEYAKRHGWLIDLDFSNVNLLQFPDDSTKRTEG